MYIICSSVQSAHAKLPGSVAGAVLVLISQTCALFTYYTTSANELATVLR